MILKDFTELSPPKRKQVSGCPAGEYTASFQFEHVSLSAPVSVRARTLIILQDPAWYTVRMYDSPYLGGTFKYDYTDFVNNIRLV